MTHPYVDNKSPFAFEPVFLADEGGQPLFVPIIKGTYTIEDSSRVELAEEQVMISLAGEPRGDPAMSSYKYEPECAFVKLATDCVLLGHAYAPHAGATETEVGFRVGSVKKSVHVVGDRDWVKVLGKLGITKSQPFERIALIYELAFGGWDHEHSTSENTLFEPRNPVGRGFRMRWNDSEEAVQLPNIEDPARPIRSLRDRPPPAGFGFISPHWQPRASLAGTYDQAWMKTRMPLLPKDFDRRFFNAASPGLVASGFLKGDEPVTVLNASPNGRIEFSLPGVAPPQIRVELRGRRNEVLQTNLDTVIVNTDENIVLLLWRAHLVIREVPQDIVSVVVESEGLVARARIS